MDVTAEITANGGRCAPRSAPPCRGRRAGHPRVDEDGDPRRGADQRHGHVDRGEARRSGHRGRSRSHHRAVTGSVTAGGEAVEPIRCEVTDRVAVVTIDRTARRNALNLAALSRLDDAVASAVADGAAAVVLRGEGGHFCAGADLKELEDQSFDTRLRGVLERIATAPVPTFAAISGACMGLGMQLALACDIRVATDDAYFGIPAGKLGLVVNHWTLQRLALNLGFGAARLMVLTAETFTSDDARRLGFTRSEVTSTRRSSSPAGRRTCALVAPGFEGRAQSRRACARRTGVQRRVRAGVEQRRSHRGPPGVRRATQPGVQGRPEPDGPRAPVGGEARY